jgi:hypothetical protein
MATKKPLKIKKARRPRKSRVKPAAPRKYTV